MEKYRESGGMGFTTAGGDCGLEGARGMNDAITREQMYSTTFLFFFGADAKYVSLTQEGELNGKCERTCSLIAFLSPKTT